MEGADAGLVQGLQPALALGIGRPQPQLRPRRVRLVDPAVAIVVERGEFGEAVAAGRAEELAAVVDAAVGVAIEGEEAAAAQQWQLFPAAVAVEIEVEAHVRQGRCRAAEVQHQRVLQALVAGTQAERHRLGVAARHREAELEADLGAVGGAHHARSAEAQLLGLGVGGVEVVRHAEADAARRLPGPAADLARACQIVCRQRDRRARLERAQIEATHRLAGQELDHAHQHGQARITVDRVFRDRVHRADLGLRAQCGLGGRGDLHRPAPGLPPGCRASRRIAPELEALARFERLREAVGGLEFDVEGGDLHGRACALRGDRCLTASGSRP